MKEFSLYKTLAVLTIAFLFIAIIGTIDFTGSDDFFNTIAESSKQELKLKNWHYMLVIWLLAFNK